ncbi:MAG: hypothetical protein WCF90_03645 [Methanomicrobiales archaeon]
METSRNDNAAGRVVALELKVMNMNARVKGLLAELLDYRAVFLSLTRENEEHDRQLLWQGTYFWPPVPEDSSSSSLPAAVLPDSSPRLRQRGTWLPDLLVQPAAPEMVMIIQSDRTLKMEPRYGEAKHIDFSEVCERYRRYRSCSSNQNHLIYAEEEELFDRAKV